MNPTIILLWAAVVGAACLLAVIVVWGGHKMIEWIHDLQVVIADRQVAQSKAAVVRQEHEIKRRRLALEQKRSEIEQLRAIEQAQLAYDTARKGTRAYDLEQVKQERKLLAGENERLRAEADRLREQVARAEAQTSTIEHSEVLAQRLIRVAQEQQDALAERVRTAVTAEVMQALGHLHEAVQQLVQGPGANAAAGEERLNQVLVLVQDFVDRQEQRLAAAVDLVQQVASGPRSVDPSAGQEPSLAAGEDPERQARQHEALGSMLRDILEESLGSLRESLAQDARQSHRGLTRVGQDEPEQPAIRAPEPASLEPNDRPG